MSFEKNTSPEKGQETELQQAGAGEIQHTQDSFEHGHKLQKIHDILESFDFSDSKEDEYREFLLGQENQFLEETLSKPRQERLQLLIQAQVNELKSKGLKDLSRAERVKFSKLKEQLIGSEKKKLKKQQEATVTEKAETEENLVTISTEQTETVDITKTDQKVSELRSVLLENSALHNSSSSQIFENLFAELDNVDGENEAGKREILQRIINKLKSPGILESIAKDLGGTETKAYREFKTQLLVVEPDLQASFDRAEMSIAGSLAQLKLGTNTLDGVNLENDTLIQTNGNLVIEAGKDERSLSLVESSYKLLK